MSNLPNETSGIKWFEHNARLACEYASLGFAVFATGPDKRPRCRWGDEGGEFATTPEGVGKLWKGRERSLCAIRLDLSGVLVLDADRHGDGPDGVAGLRELFKEHRVRASQLPIFATPGGGIHVYFQNPKGLRSVPQGKAFLPPGVEIKGAGGMSIAPFTMLPDGRSYSPLTPRGINFARREEPVMPEWLEELAYPPKPEWSWKPTTTPKDVKDLDALLKAVWKGEYDAVAFAANGGRMERLNRAAFKLGLKMVGPGTVSWSEVEEHLLRAAEANGLMREHGQSDLRKVIRSGMKAGVARSGGAV
jgi:hypothetical protein